MGDTFPKVKLAAAQIAPVLMDRDATVDKTCRFIEEAADNGANIIGFPEYHISGPAYWYFVKDTNPLLEEKKYFRTFVKESVEVPSPATDRLCRSARAGRIYVVVGISERDPNSFATLYNAQIYIGPDGNILGVHRKLMPTATEKMYYSRGDGSSLYVFPTEFGELGGLLCGEHANSLAKFSLIARGEKLHVASWPAFPDFIFPPVQRESVLFRVRQHAHEGKLFLINSTGHLDEQNIDYLCETPEERARLKVGGGCSAIIGPNGEFLAGPLEDVEGIVYADVDMEDAVEAKWWHDVLGNYGRFDVLNLNFNAEPQAALHMPAQAARPGRADVQEMESRLKSLEQRIESLQHERIDI